MKLSVMGTKGTKCEAHNNGWAERNNYTEVEETEEQIKHSRYML